LLTRRIALWLVAAAALTAQNGPPQRIVSTAPSITEMLYALGLGDRVVGVTRFCRYPPEAQQKPKIGDYINPNLEAIAALRPDLVMVQTNPVRLAERLQALHLRTLEVDQQNLAALYNSIHVTGAATGASARAEQLIGSIQSQLEAVRKRAAELPRRRVMFVVGRAPGRLDGLVVAGKSSFLTEVISVAGGDNIFRDAAAAYPEVSLEEVLSRNPEVIIDMGDMGDVGDTGGGAISEQHRSEIVGLWQRLPTISAVKQHQVFAIASEIYLVPGPRVVDAARSLFDMLHPNAPGAQK
jgi:iron complex transport system substrate-binding protein